MNRRDFLVLYFCVVNFRQSIFNLEKIFAGKMFSVRYFFLRELIFVDRWKIAKTRNAKILCHTVSLVYLNFFCFVGSLSPYLRKTIKKNRSVQRRKASARLKFRVQYH